MKLPNYLTNPTPEQEAAAEKAGAGVGIEYPAGTITGRWTDNRPRFTELTRERRVGPPMWPLAYMSGPRKLFEATPVTDAERALVNADFSKLEERIAAWHKEFKP